MRRWGAVAALPAAVLLVVATTMVSDPARARSTTGAVIAVTPSFVSVGDSTRVDFDHWPAGVATAQVCGNRAQRGSTDCDGIGAGSIRIPESGANTVAIRVLNPPVGCPCVVRATDLTGAVVRTAPIQIAGVSGGVDIPAPTGAGSATDLQVTSALVTTNRSFPSSWAPAFGGPADHSLVLKVRNRGDQDVTGLRVAGTVGHGAGGGDPFSAPLPVVPADATRTVRVPVAVPAPSWGTWHVAGAVYGSTSPIAFVLETEHDPWALELAIPVLLLLLARYLRWCERRRQRRAEPLAALADAAETASTEFPQSSPVVGVDDRRSWVSSPYSDAVVSEAVPPPDGAPVPVGAGADQPA